MLHQISSNHDETKLVPDRKEIGHTGNRVYKKAVNSLFVFDGFYTEVGARPAGSIGAWELWPEQLTP